METAARKETILIVDDTPANIEILSELLSSEYEVLFATGGEDALEIAVDENPDLILLDVVMPGMDGYEVCSRLKADARTRAIPVIFVTAMDHEEDETKGLDAGAIDYLTKPIRPPIVRARMRNHIQLKRYRDALESLSSSDGLTGIANRRRFDELLDQEWTRARRSHNPLSLTIMDIDHFKAFNDHYGHLAGDDCLRKVAGCLAESVRRPADLVARYGGEEFACLLPDTHAEGAVCVANHIREKVNAMKIPHSASPVADHVTLSMGVSTMIPVIGQSFFDLIRRADELMYEAKNNGRNSIKSQTQ
jgi:diguanylate cyclase (GGDEF)-like protein